MTQVNVIVQIAEPDGSLQFHDTVTAKLEGDTLLVNHAATNSEGKLKGGHYPTLWHLAVAALNELGIK